MTTRTTSQGISFSLPVTALTIAAAVALPFIAHLLPAVGGVPMGARFLPIFYAPLLAVIWRYSSAALIASLVTPTINYLLTGMPTPEMTVLITIELVVFSLVVMALRNRWPNLWVMGPLAYVAAKVVSMLVLFVVALVPAPPTVFFTNSLVNAIPGLIVLLVLNVLAVKFYNDRHNVG